MVRYTLLNSAGLFSKKQAGDIEEVFLEAVRSVRGSLEVLPDIDVVFYHNPDYVVPDTGIGGNTDSENLIFIPLDATVDISMRELLFVVRHELHHAVRMSKLGQTDSLIKKVISEGLADQFELCFDPAYRSITYRDDIKQADLLMGLEDLITVIEGGDYNYYEWFFGYDDTYPNWLGYTLGNMIVEKYCRRHDTNAAELVYEPAESFVDTAKELMRELRGVKDVTA